MWNSAHLDHACLHLLTYFLLQYKDSNGENKGNLGFSLSYHTGGQIVSDEKVDFSEFGVIRTTKTYLVMVSWTLKYEI